MSKESERLDVPSVIRVIRNHRVVLDSDLAKLYGVTTKRLNEAVKRNGKRFPSDFMFRLESQEFATLISQLTASKKNDMRSQIATALDKRNIRHPPYAFTEQLQPLMLPSPPREQKRIGFNVKEKLTGYCVQRKPKSTAKKQSAGLQ